MPKKEVADAIARQNVRNFCNANGATPKQRSFYMSMFDDYSQN